MRVTKNILFVFIVFSYICLGVLPGFSGQIVLPGGVKAEVPIYIQNVNIPGISGKMVKENFRELEDHEDKNSRKDLIPGQCQGNNTKDFALMINSETREKNSSLDSSDLPFNLGRPASRIIMIKDKFDDTTLDTINSTMRNLPIVKIKASKAVLRPSGNGLELRINIAGDE